MAETAELSGLELRVAVARALGWHWACHSGRWYGPLIQVIDGDAQGDNLPAHESDPATLTEMWRWLEAKGWKWSMGVNQSGEYFAIGNTLDYQQTLYTEKADNPVTAVARLVVAIATRGQEKGQTNA